MAAVTTDADVKVIVRNRSLRHDYEVLEVLECGLVLLGSEVKSLRNGEVQLADAHAHFERGELWLHSLHIAEYRFATQVGHIANAPRKVLLHQRQARDLHAQVKEKGLTLIPERLLLRKGWVKVELALCRGKRHADKRHDLKNRAAKRDIDRELARRARGR